MARMPHGEHNMQGAACSLKPVAACTVETIAACPFMHCDKSQASCDPRTTLHVIKVKLSMARECSGRCVMTAR